MQSFHEEAIAFLLSMAGVLLIGRPAIRLLGRQAAPVRFEDCPPLLAHQRVKAGTPTMGGMFVLAVAVLVAAAAGGLSGRQGWMVLGALLGLGGVGLADDCLKFTGPNALGIRSLPKLLLAMAVAGAFGFASRGLGIVEVPWLHRTLALGGWWIPFAMLVMTGCAHAVNLTDGLDGLAAGCLAIAFAVLGIWTLRDARCAVLAPWCASLAGACIGFLWFNSHPASVFLGDVGALGLGAALAALSLLSGTALWLVIIGGVFVVEAVSVMLQVASYKWRGKRRIFRVAPIHHHFQLGGLSEPKIMVRFWMVGLLLAVLGLASREGPG